MYLQQLYSLSLGLNLFQHFTIENFIQILGPLIRGLRLAFIHYTRHYDLYDDKEVLMREEHQIFE